MNTIAGLISPAMKTTGDFILPLPAMNTTEGLISMNTTKGLVHPE